MAMQMGEVVVRSQAYTHLPEEPPRRNHAAEKLVAYEGNATRTPVPDYTFVPREALDAIVRRFELGAMKHGRDNWKGGGEEFRRASINHLFRHLLDYIENGNTTDANTDAIICNAAMLCYFERKLGPYGQ